MSAVVWSIAPAEVNATDDVCWARFRLSRTACFFCKSSLAPVSRLPWARSHFSSEQGEPWDSQLRDPSSWEHKTLWVSGACTSLWTLSLGRSPQHLGLQCGGRPLQVDGVTDTTGCLLGTLLSVLLGHFSWVVSFHSIFSCTIKESFIWPGMAALGCAVYH